MAEDATITLERMQEQLWAVTGLSPCLSTVHRSIVGFDFSFKVLKVQVQAAVTEEALAARRAYSRWLMDTVIGNQNTVYVDEVGFSGIVLEDMAVLGLSYKFLPPYSPFFNPIENFFSQWKTFVRAQKPRDEAELFTAMGKVRDKVTAAQCNNYVTKTNKNCQECIDGRDEFDN